MKDMSPKLIKQIIGAAGGVVIGVMMRFIGFFRTLLLVLLGLLGWWLCGSRVIPQPVKEFAARAAETVEQVINNIAKKRW